MLRLFGGVRERPNRHDWKSCDLQGSVGSNPTSSAAVVTITTFWLFRGYFWSPLARASNEGHSNPGLIALDDLRLIPRRERVAIALTAP